MEKRTKPLFKYRAVLRPTGDVRFYGETIKEVVEVAARQLQLSAADVSQTFLTVSLSGGAQYSRFAVQEKNGCSACGGALWTLVVEEKTRSECDDLGVDFHSLNLGYCVDADGNKRCRGCGSSCRESQPDAASQDSKSLEDAKLLRRLREAVDEAKEARYNLSDLLQECDLRLNKGD